MNRRVAWVIVALVGATLLSGVAIAYVLGPQSTGTITFLQIDLTPSGFPASVSPGGTYYFNITARSTYATDQTGVFIVVTLPDSCADLSSRGFALSEKSATYGGYTPIAGADASGSCRFMHVGITATVPAGSAPVVYWFEERVTSTIPNMSWSFQAARQN